MLVHLIAALSLAAAALEGEAPTNVPAAHSRFGLDVGLTHLQAREANLLPLVHSDLEPSLALHWRRAHPSSEHEVRVTLRYERPNTAWEELRPSIWINDRLEYAYARRAAELLGGTLFAGGVVGIGHAFAFYQDWDDSHLYWATDLPLSARAVWRHGIGASSTLQLLAQVPLFAMISRPSAQRARDVKADAPAFGPALRNLHSNLEPAFWNHHFRLDARAELAFALTESVQQSFFYQLGFQRTTRAASEPYVHLLNEIGISLSF